MSDRKNRLPQDKVSSTALTQSPIQMNRENYFQNDPRTSIETGIIERQYSEMVDSLFCPGELNGLGPLKFSN